MSRKGNCWENVVAESFYNTIKTERLERFEFNSFDMAYSIIFGYKKGWDNTVRIHLNLNGITPMQYFYNNVVFLVA